MIKKLVQKNFNITFIGMPGAGKSFLSNKLANKYNLQLLELDEMIEKKHSSTLFNILNTYGESKLKQYETDIICNINLDKGKQVISTGGSVIYSKKGMNHLMHKNNIIIFLNENYDILQERTENFTNRGIIFNGLTPQELYNERYQKYLDYCDIKIDSPFNNI